MNDIVSTHKRSQMMAGIRRCNTGPELRVRSALHSLGYRFRLHRKDLPGSPDVVLPKHKLVIFVHGCFWHFHSNCRFAKVPVSNKDFWLAKLLRNRERDAAAVFALKEAGWRVLLIWECFLRVNEKDEAALLAHLSSWIQSEQMIGELSGVIG